MLLLLLALGANPEKPHPHNGVLTPFNAGPPPKLTASEVASLETGKPVMKTVEMPGRGGGSAVAVFDVAAPPEVVWGCINDLENYPRMVPGVAETSIYSVTPLGGGGKLTKAKYTIAMLGYRVSYFIELKFEPRLNSMTFKLDYTRSSDLDDATGYWHVVPLSGKGGESHSRVTYMAAMKLKAWLPKPITDFLLTTTLGQATGWVVTQAEARHSAGSRGKAPLKQCHWKWLPFPRRKCETISPPPPPPPPSPGSQMYGELMFSFLGVVPLMFICALNRDRGQY
ncbi:hypothetical protein AB1Y20_015228 [Prymnesium parvum]|uniref:Coenzyme Q-binding protein COQ10 START domain-containing protein n=1 Tax=Prymnesium parvum TaxID=97485 RepID=A0AB34JWG1_PRYPA|mmetsp:Transcript_44948/g.103211  ORF Transcript_44948/g.103211 Transcript_44948/m.103211 type:complete len:283 (-) Transcript_44948:326-1174(-)